MPTSRLESLGWIHEPRVPLGDEYRGACHANANATHEPSESDLRELCNCGYARGRCAHLPAGCADSVRFSVAADDRRLVQLIWIREREHSPDSFGTLDYLVEADSFSADPVAPPNSSATFSAIVEAQARAFLASHRRRSTAGGAAQAAVK